MPIPTTPFGPIPLHLPRLAIGLAALGRPGYINLGHGQDLEANYEVASMERRTHEMLNLAYERGVRYFDAARSYGKAKDFLLSWLKKYPEKIDGRRLFDPVQATFNVLEPSAGPSLQEAAANGMGVIIKDALANRRLTARNRAEAFALKRRMLESLADKYGVGIDAIALAYVLNFPWAHLAFSGAARPDHLSSNPQAGDVTRNGRVEPPGHAG